MAGSPSLSWLERSALRFLMRRQPAPSADPWHLMSATERKGIARIRTLLLTGAACCGALGVVAYYVPVRTHPEWFPDTLLFGSAIPLRSTAFSVLLGIAEVAVLTLLNLWAVQRISVICGFPDTQSPEYEQDIAALAQAGLEKRDKRLLSIGINPYHGASRWSVALFNLLNVLKALLSNLLVKFVVARLLGRGVVRMAVDMVGVPIYAFWNAWAAWVVVKEARIRIMAPTLIDQQVTLLQTHLSPTPEIQQALYDLLFLAATAKRRFHFAQYAFGFALMRAFSIEEKTTHETREPVEKVLSRFPKDALPAVLHAFAVFLILDGRVSPRTRAFAAALEKTGGVSPGKLEAMCRAYLRGEGI